MTAMKTPKEATRDVHVRMQKKLGVKQLFSELACYRELTDSWSLRAVLLRHPILFRRQL